MTLHISLADFAQKLSQQTGKHIHVYQSQSQQITVSYLIDIKLDLLSHNEDAVQFAYTFPWGAGWLLKMFSHINSKKFTLNTSDKTVWVHLDAFAAYRNEVAGQKITQVHLQNGALVIETEPLSQA